MELAVFLIFFHAVSGHRPQDAGKSKFEEWTFAVIAGAVGFFVSLLMNFGVALFRALRGSSPELPHRFDQSLLVFQTWGFLVPSSGDSAPSGCPSFWACARCVEVGCSGQ